MRNRADDTNLRREFRCSLRLLSNSSFLCHHASFFFFLSLLSSFSLLSHLSFPQSPNPLTPLLYSCRNYSRHSFFVDQYLSCSMPEKTLRVAVLLSGGVALCLLHAAGHSCTSFYLKIWLQEGIENFWNQCLWEDDLKYAKHVCKQL